MVTVVYLIRHCEAEGNTRGVFQGSLDGGVSGNGEKQLELLSLRFRNIPLDSLYSSPLRRALETACAVNRFHNLEIRQDERLREINGGQMEGLRWDELAHLFPQQMQTWTGNPGDFCAPQGESMRQVRQRMGEALRTVVRQNPGKTAAVVSHGCAIRNMLCLALQKPLSQLGTVPWCDNTAVSVLEYDGENAAPRVRLMNDAGHLTPEISVFAKQTWWRQTTIQEENV